ncbi:MAG: hypothetical protein EPN23_03655 [Verrucomicrobia bacterium]|nr:MAG: hypothetical protein EPN23_03655 [Verrucomicrobiota bacterium]
MNAPSSNTPVALPLLQRGLVLFKFMASGLPSFLLALPANYFLVEQAHWNKSLAYALIMTAQVTVNFFICRAWVFGRRDRQTLWQEFSAFFTGIMAFRCGDWAFYTLLTWLWPRYYLLVQCGNVAVFGLLKFLFSERLFKRKATSERDAKGAPE